MNGDELKKIRGNLTQEQMSKRLQTPLSTYRKWEQGVRKVPAWVSMKLTEEPQITIPGLTLEDAIALGNFAREQGLTMEAAIGLLIRDGLRKIAETPAFFKANHKNQLG